MYLMTSETREPKCHNALFKALNGLVVRQYYYGAASRQIQYHIHYITICYIYYAPPPKKKKRSDKTYQAPQPQHQPRQNIRQLVRPRMRVRIMGDTVSVICQQHYIHRPLNLVSWRTSQMDWPINDHDSSSILTCQKTSTVNTGNYAGTMM